jgi:hypothetical protein
MEMSFPLSIKAYEMGKNEKVPFLRDLVDFGLPLVGENCNRVYTNNNQTC